MGHPFFHKESKMSAFRRPSLRPFRNPRRRVVEVEEAIPEPEPEPTPEPVPEPEPVPSSPLTTEPESDVPNEGTQ